MSTTRRGAIQASAAALVAGISAPAPAETAATDQGRKEKAGDAEEFLSLYEMLDADTKRLVMWLMRTLVARKMERLEADQR